MFRTVYFFFCLIILPYTLIGQDLSKFKKINWRIYHQLNFVDYIDINSDEWKNISPMQKRELMQIPDSELKTMSTEELIESYLNCAFTRSFFLFSEVDIYYRLLSKAFNGVNELINRSDAVDEIIKYYATLNPKDNTINISGIETAFQIQFLEYLIGNSAIIKKINSDQLPLITFELIKKYEIKKELHPVFIETIESNIYAISKLLGRIETGKHNEISVLEDINILQRTGRILNDKIVPQVIDLANDFIDN